MKNLNTAFLALAMAVAVVSAFPTFRLTSRAPDVEIDAVRALMPHHGRPNETVAFPAVAGNRTLVSLAGRNVTMLDKRYFRTA
ncbi:uncharacterized protein B0I36DRAFT_363638 [Microdochium trichocladiopsis]|uniref:Uncharacterized protein n=1 Tax=Microdochium trichocladiopsis TaxID=1682393 RepID=A0A9P8Y3H5_9PEZI|nr:uncharacterized protein B0I36DRAFT_363638 [Microdochium trichocladiopsis]KAH7029043.1 hypothetical protein B0I36DRAFT_363638 [Microdochium trichocladiopsis]